MPYQFEEWENEPETQAASVRGGGPPRKIARIGVLDPPVPPKRPLAALPASFLLRILVGLILAGIVISTLLLLFRR